MKNKKMFRMFTVLLAVMLCMAAFPLTAYAGGGDESEAEPPIETIIPEPEADPATINPVTLTPDGNLTLVDDIEGEQAEDKQFITVVTKDGNYFYIIIDRAGDGQNVHFLNMVDEVDLLALIEDMDTAPAQTTPDPVTVEPEPTPTGPEPDPEPENESGGMGGIILIVFVLAAGGGAVYYFKVIRPKQAVKGGTDLSDLDDLDFDGDEFLNIGEADTGIDDGQEDEDE